MRFLACALLVIATTHTTKACTPGDIRQNGTNICFCSIDGSNWNCPPIEGQCVPGTVFKYYCNECDCQADELVDNAVCTTLRCDRNKWNEDGTVKYPEEDETSQQNEDDEYEDVENVTTDFILHPVPRRISVRRGRYCQVGEVFRHYCNHCVCGIRYIIGGSPCTNLVCDLRVWNKNGSKKSGSTALISEHHVATPKNVPEKERCYDGQMFRKYCNYCFCQSDETISGAACTNLVCNLSVWNKNGTTKI